MKMWAARRSQTLVSCARTRFAQVLAPLASSDHIRCMRVCVCVCVCVCVFLDSTYTCVITVCHMRYVYMSAFRRRDLHVCVSASMVQAPVRERAH